MTLTIGRTIAFLALALLLTGCGNGPENQRLAFYQAIESAVLTESDTQIIMIIQSSSDLVFFRGVNCHLSLNRRDKQGIKGLFNLNDKDGTLIFFIDQADIASIKTGALDGTVTFSGSGTRTHIFQVIFTSKSGTKDEPRRGFLIHSLGILQ